MLDKSENTDSNSSVNSLNGETTNMTTLQFYNHLYGFLDGIIEEEDDRFCLQKKLNQRNRSPNQCFTLTLQ